MTDRIEAREGVENTGAFRGPYYDFVGRMGPYPQGPTTKGIHTPPEGDDFPVSELAVDDQTSNPAPTTERLLQVRPRNADDPSVEGDFEPMEPELEPDPVDPGTPVIDQQPGFAHGDPGTGLENIHTEDPEPGETPDEVIELVITEPADGATVPPVHAIRGTGASKGGTVALWHLEIEERVAETVADDTGAWAFDGDTPAAPGQMTWEVRQASHSAQVQVTVEEETPPLGGARRDDGWQGLNRHADLDDYLKSRFDLVESEEWAGLTIAEKKAWLDRNAR
jgi:hypothetical protein